MFLRAKTEIKDGKEHRYWSVVENRRVSGGKTIQRQVLYLGEIASGQQAQWNRALEAFDEGTGRMTQIALFPEDRTGAAPEALPEAVQVRLKDFDLGQKIRKRCLIAGISGKHLVGQGQAFGRHNEGDHNLHAVRAFVPAVAMLSLALGRRIAFEIRAGQIVEQHIEARIMRRKKLKKFWARLKELLKQTPSRDQLLLKIGAAQKEAGRAKSLVTITLPKAGQSVTPETFTFTLNRKRLRACRRHEGRYLLRSNLTGKAPAELWAFYIQLTEVEQAFKELKGDLAIRPVYHQSEERIEAHIFVAFLAYCLQVTLKQRLRALAPGLTPRAVLEKFAASEPHIPVSKVASEP